MRNKVRFFSEVDNEGTQNKKKMKLQNINDLCFCFFLDLDNGVFHNQITKNEESVEYEVNPYLVDALQKISNDSLSLVKDYCKIVFFVLFDDNDEEDIFLIEKLSQCLNAIFVGVNIEIKSMQKNSFDESAINSDILTKLERLFVTSFSSDPNFLQQFQKKLNNQSVLIDKECGLNPKDLACLENLFSEQYSNIYIYLDIDDTVLLRVPTIMAILECQMESTQEAVDVSVPTINEAILSLIARIQQIFCQEKTHYHFLTARLRPHESIDETNIEALSEYTIQSDLEQEAGIKIKKILYCREITNNTTVIEEQSIEKGIKLVDHYRKEYKENAGKSLIIFADDQSVHVQSVKTEVEKSLGEQVDLLTFQVNRMGIINSENLEVLQQKIICFIDAFKENINLKENVSAQEFKIRELI